MLMTLLDLLGLITWEWSKRGIGKTVCYLLLFAGELFYYWIFFVNMLHFYTGAN